MIQLVNDKNISFPGWKHVSPWHESNKKLNNAPTNENKNENVIDNAVKKLSLVINIRFGGISNPIL